MILPAFKNEPTTNFDVDVNRRAFEKALMTVKAQLGQFYPILVGRHEIADGERFESVNPARPGQVVGRHAVASPSQADTAVRAAQLAFPSWAATRAEDRARLLFRAAELIRRRRHELSALMVYEVGKPWDEADGETAEAVDLMEWYGREVLRLAGPQPITPFVGEVVEYFNIPLGVGLVISPWNFPLALTTGMMTAAMVTGNTVIVKPAENSSTTVAWLVNIFRELNVPPGVLNYVTGRGSVVGEAMVDHPGVRFIAFTGSREVGVRIYERAARLQPTQRWLKRVQLELGGKNAVVVDETADLEDAAQGIVTSAFSFQGQKCSAGSRAILVGDIYDEVVSRVVDKASRLKVGDPIDPAVSVGPLIDGNAHERVLDYIEVGKQEAELLLGGRKGNGDGYFVNPTIFGKVDPASRIAQEEIFGPVLAVIPARDFDDALAIANRTDYGLTGSLFSRDPVRIRRARDEMHVGNLYINRKSTGAMMGVHPFGGFNMSGTDSKAGGPDYLHFFLQGKAVGERL
jgi:1-pyrroline-5-carboxylate dehydrogenase